MKQMISLKSDNGTKVSTYKVGDFLPFPVGDIKL